MSALTVATCKMYMITIAPRHVFFSHLDESISQCFTFVLFGFAFLLYCIVQVFDELGELGKESIAPEMTGHSKHIATQVVTP